MAISYPIFLPATSGITSISFKQNNAVVMAKSPFTLVSQVQDFGGRLLTATVTVTNLMREEAEKWIGSLSSLQGPLKTFYLGDPSAREPRGFATGTPVIDGANQTGNSINIRGASPNTFDWLKRGDWVEIGTGIGVQRLYRLVERANTDAAGKTTLEIWPSVRTPYVDGTAVVMIDTKGIFRLQGDYELTQDNTNKYSIRFNCEEAI